MKNIVVKKNDMYWFGGMRVQKPDPITAMFLKTNVTDSCWLFNGVIAKNGYGLIKHKGKVHPAHRFLWETFFGPIDKNLVCCHKCDVRNCINPLHIFIGTRTENQKDMKNKGRAASGSRNGIAKLKESDIPIIRKMYEDGIFQKDIGKKFGVSQSVIGKIVRKITWDHVE